MWGPIVFVAIVGLAIVLRSGWRPSWKRTTTPAATPIAPAAGGHGTPAATPASAKSLAATVAGWLGVGLLLIFVVGMGSCVYRCNVTAPAQEAAERKAAIEYARAHPAPPAEVPAIEKPWTLKTLDIPAEGLAVYLYPGWEDYALGGDITITPPEGGKVLHDQPGADHNWGRQPEGIYLFRADPPGPRKVSILNRW